MLLFYYRRRKSKAASIYTEQKSDRGHLKRSVPRSSDVEYLIHGRSTPKLPAQPSKPVKTLFSVLLSGGFIEDIFNDVNEMLMMHLKFYDYTSLYRTGKVKFVKFELDCIEKEREFFPILSHLKEHPAIGINPDKNPVFWTIDEVSKFIRAFCEKDLSRDIRMDGVAFLNTEKEHLIKYFDLDESDSERLQELVSALKQETIKKFMHVVYLDNRNGK